MGINRNDFLKVSCWPSFRHFSNRNVLVKESSYQIVLDDNVILPLGRGGFAEHDMIRGSKIALVTGEQQTVTKFTKSVDKKLSCTGYAYSLDTGMILNCNFHYKGGTCNVCAINDFHKTKNIETGEKGVKNCEIYYHKPDIFYMTTEVVLKGEEFLTDYGEDFNLPHFMQQQLDMQPTASSSSSSSS